MNETKRTLAFVAVALVSVGAATATFYGSRPRKDVESARIGTEFYPEFKFPTEAQALRVVAYDKDTASVKEFKVEYKDGKWRIPSHHDYPADGKDRLARTAASVIGTSRAAFVSRSKSDEARYDVVDPEDPDETILTGRGQKITISKNDGTVLAEYIIGKKKESTGPGEGDVYYVRATRTDDPSTIYLADLKIDLSTKFGDWIEPDLLKVDRELLNDIRIDSYSIDEQQGAIIPGEITELTRKNPSDPWTLKGIKPTEQLKTDAVNTLVNNLDNLRLAGVRPKPPGILPDLSIDPRYARDQRLVMVLRSDMQDRGFFIGTDRKDNTQKVYAKEGELEAGTSEGLRYALKFGQIFTGTEFEIETGLSKDKDKGAAKEGDKTKATDAAAKSKASKSEVAGKDKDAPAKDAAGKDAAGKEKDKGKDKGKDKEQLKRRYLMVYVMFDPKLCGEPPTRPLEPKKPQGLVLDHPAPAPKSAPAAPKKPGSSANNSGAKNSGTKVNAKPSAAGKSDQKHSSARTLDDSRMLALALPDPPPASPPTSAKSDTKPAPAASAPAPKGPSASTKPAPATKPGAATKPGPATKSGTATKPVAKAKAAPAKPSPKAEYDKALAQYKKDMERYNNDKSEYQKKLKKGRDKAKQLNERFGPWYYVISAESFENLRQGRASLVQPKGITPKKKAPARHLEGLPMESPAR